LWRRGAVVAFVEKSEEREADGADSAIEIEIRLMVAYVERLL
jgi:hypothetical protein